VRLSELKVGLPIRLLFVGLPITLLLLFFTTMGIMPELSYYGALLVAASLTPTDAGLGAPTVLNPKVPSLIRHALNVESGVNDGMVTPIVLIAIEGLLSAGNGGDEPDIAKVALVSDSRTAQDFVLHSD
jgi:NhaP-type Na+/H+ or K+/H+ antiporter